MNINTVLNPLTELVDHSKRIIELPQGEVLYHGTIESYDARKASTGGYDSLFWTAEDKEIAKMYIPYYGGIHTDPYRILHILTYNNEERDSWAKFLGITDAIDRKLWAYQRSIYDKWDELEKITKEYTAKYKNAWDEIPEEDMDAWAKAEDELEEIKKKPRKDDILMKFIIKQLNKMGYKITSPHDKVQVDQDKDNNLIPKGPSKGRLAKVVTLRPMKLFNYGHEREGDLTDVEYNHLSKFRDLEEQGFDGVVINDFAQSKHHGNYGHKSIGFFKKALPDLKVRFLSGDHFHPTVQ